MFSDFYDGFFELLDYETKSALVTEYTRLVRNITQDIKEAEWFKEMKLHYKAHTRRSPIKQPY